MDFRRKRYFGRSAENILYKNIGSERENSISLTSEGDNTILGNEERNWTLPPDWSTRYNCTYDENSLPLCYHLDTSKKPNSGKISFHHSKRISSSEYRGNGNVKKDVKCQEGFANPKSNFEQSSKGTFSSSSRRSREASLTKNKLENNNRSSGCTHCSRTSQGSVQSRNFYSSPNRSNTSCSHSKVSDTLASSYAMLSRSCFPITIETKQSPFVCSRASKGNMNSNSRTSKIMDINTSSYSFSSRSLKKPSFQNSSRNSIEGSPTYLSRSSSPEFKPSFSFSSRNTTEPRNHKISKNVDNVTTFYRTPSRISQFLYNPCSTLNCISRRKYSTSESPKMDLTPENSRTSVHKYSGYTISNREESTEGLDRKRTFTRPMNPAYDQNFSLKPNPPVMRLSDRSSFTLRSRSPSCH